MLRICGPAGADPGNDRDDRDHAAVLVSAGVHRRADPMEWGQRIIELGAGACALSETALYEKQIPRCARNDKTFHAQRCARWKRSELAPIGLPERLGQAGLAHLVGCSPG